jgi:putative hemolysin
MQEYLLLRAAGVALLILANAFFVTAEFALVTIRRTRVQTMVEAGVTGARALERIQGQLDTLLSATQLGVTLAALALGWVAEPFFVHLFEPLLRLHPLSPAAHRFMHGVFAGLGFITVTLIDVIVGEVAPKSLALRFTERLALACAVPMEGFISLTRPLLRLVSGAAKLLLIPFGASAASAAERVHSPEELKLLVTASMQLGQLAPFQDQIIERVLDLHEVPVREIMTPRHEVLALPASTTFQMAVEFIAEHPRSRFPVFEQDLDHPVGVLYAKDLLRLLGYRQTWPALSGRSIRALQRPLRIVPESKSVGELLLEFQSVRSHIAGVVDEFGTFVGLVTAEDVLEEIVGELQDEHEVAEPPAVPIGDRPAIVEGLSSLRDLETQYGLELPRDGSYETLAGFLLLQLGHIPAPGEQVENGGYRFTILDMDGHRIGQVKIERAVASPP